MNNWSINWWHCFLIRLGGIFAGYFAYQVWDARHSIKAVRRQHCKQALCVMLLTGLASWHGLYSGMWDYSHRFGLVFYGTGLSAALLSASLVFDLDDIATNQAIRKMM